ncbi:sensor histidine kinase [Pararhizobium sp. BT-229]|uniref:sensor histidine kinase n=1 Tax=Pararhizobium sp. BT-229 TaxID=2986923 RepID=UPI0021F6A7FB|nr:sensor histidine kinase [Pararhizobium sp. BT-229]MCV9965683.1 sensor histidine kinase [Pararhizobium sp. BT-229]
MTAITPLHPEASLSLALAVIASSSAPIVLLDGNLCVIAASNSFYQAFLIDSKTTEAKQFSQIGEGEWNVAQLSALLQATAAGMADVHGYEMDLKRPGHDTRRLVLSAQKLDYADASVRLLLTVADVTDARIAEKLKDDLLRDKAILLQEVQHRVANSLQIIASILLQSARKVQSEETRTHLTSAHSRVMSIAAVQQQLAASSVGEVELRSYFEQLCRSLGASMIHDPEQLSIDVNVDKTVTEANISVSLGLIVTELVINALKHAFPNQRKGKITVDYHTNGKDWTLQVGDDGIGMPTNADDAKPGLGTGIVEALSNQLEAEITVTDAMPGTKVSITHRDEIVIADKQKAA